MGDVFKEQLVKRKSTTKDFIIKAGSVALAFILFLVASIIPVVGTFSLLILAAEVFGLWHLFSYLNVEYEYIFTNGELDIDAVYNKARRKRMFSGSVSEFDIMARADDKTRAGDFGGATVTKDYSSRSGLPGACAFLTSYKGAKTKIIIEPNDVMLKSIKAALPPRKFFI